MPTTPVTLDGLGALAGNVFLTSDTHFAHESIVTLGSGRPFATITEHDREQIDRWNAVVTPDDTVIHLGDVAMRTHHLDAVAHLNGHKILIAGNHDACWTRRMTPRGISKARRAIQTYLDAGFEHVYDTGHATGTLAGKPVQFAHLPHHGDHHATERYQDRRPTDIHTPLICGHVHHMWQTNGGRDTRYGFQVNVGVDQWGFTPVPASVIADLIAHDRRSA